MASATWVVTITDLEEGTPHTYGPYTKDRAQRVAKLMDIYFGNDDGNRDTAPLVSAYPLQRANLLELHDEWREYKPKKEAYDG